MRGFACACRHDVAVGPDSYTGLAAETGLSRVVAPAHKQRAMGRARLLQRLASALGSSCCGKALMRGFTCACRHDVAVGPDSYTGLAAETGLSRVVAPANKQRAMGWARLLQRLASAARRLAVRDQPTSDAHSERWILSASGTVLGCLRTGLCCCCSAAAVKLISRFGDS